MLNSKIASDTKIKVKFTDETAAKIPLNFRTTAKVATTEDAVIGESIAVKPAKRKSLLQNVCGRAKEAKRGLKNELGN